MSAETAATVPGGVSLVGTLVSNTQPWHGSYPVSCWELGVKTLSPWTAIESLYRDHQKLEREARICRLLKHPNIAVIRCWGSINQAAGFCVERVKEGARERTEKQIEFFLAASLVLNLSWCHRFPHFRFCILSPLSSLSRSFSCLDRSQTATVLLTEARHIIVTHEAPACLCKPLYLNLMNTTPSPRNQLHIAKRSLSFYHTEAHCEMEEKAS
ncbi:hypothetical protein RRG08_051615 [Elysia crispata]|uniref:Protein kinase domain-containing protein n=1 Tax=Elysia crispata TaxID=231223 RepID=A0AAE1DRJ5_9GAST|nr:hypothetical protein RRG08_051615 [Elysia crispata]